MGTLLLMFLAASCSAEEFRGSVWVGDVNNAAVGGGWQWQGNGLEEVLANPSMLWMHLQLTIPEDLHDSGPARDLVRTLARAGKRVTLQLWANADGDLNWSYYSLHRIPRDEVVRGRLFSRAGECIEYVGPENLHAVYLWEEIAAVNEAWNIAKPAENWLRNYKGIVDGAHDGGTYVNRGWPIGRDKAKTDGPWDCNALTQRDALLATYGIDMLKADEWSDADWRVWRLWIARDCLAATQVQFAEYVHRRWPYLKVYTWSIPAAAGDKFTDIGWEAAHGLDGLMVDPYTDPAHAYCWVRTGRTLFGPEKDVHAILWGDGNTGEYRDKLARAAYAGGATSAGFFSGQAEKRFPVVTRWADGWTREFCAKPRPVLGNPYPTLVVADDYYNAAADLFPLLGRFDVVSSVDRYAVDESRYAEVIDTTNGPQEFWSP